MTTALHRTQPLRRRVERQLILASLGGGPSASRVAVVPGRQPALDAAPTVTVVVTCFNYGRFLEECIASVLDQQHVDVDVVVVDDASTDGSAAVVQAIADTHGPVRAVLRPTNGGPVVAFNDGLELVRGEYVVRLDADDLLTPGALARATSLLEAQPGVGLAYGRPRHFSGRTPPARGSLRSWTIWPGHEWVSLRCRQGVNCITSPEVVLRADVVRAVGGQDPRLPHTHDFEMWLRMAAASDVGRVNGIDQALHREHGGSRMATVTSGILLDLVERRRAFEVFFAGAPADLPDLDRLASDAAAALAAEALDRACRAFDRGRAGVEPVDDLVAFAVDVCPWAQQLPAWQALRRHQAASGSSRAPDAVLRALARRAREEAAHLRWRWTGV